MRSCKIIMIFLFICYAHQIFGDELPEKASEPSISTQEAKLETIKNNPAKNDEKPKAVPWFTGTLLSPPGIVTKQGHVDTQSFIYWIINKDRYGPDWEIKSQPAFYQINPQFTFWTGLIKNLDFTATFNIYCNMSQGRSSVAFGDIECGFDYQIYEADEKHWYPNVEFTIQEFFPTGKFKKLNPHKLKTDAGGLGSFATLFQLTFYKVIEFKNEKFLSLTLSFDDILFAPVRVRGFNVYNGGRDTRGTVFPGNNFTIFYGMEYTLTKSWVFAFDLLGDFFARNRFRGHSSTPVGNLSAVQWSIAPAIEYNFSQQAGILLASWFTVAGRNAFCFYSFDILYSYNF